MRAQNPHNLELLTNAQAAEILQLSPRTLERWRCIGDAKIPYLRIGKVIRYRRSDLEGYLTSCEAGDHAGR